MSRSPRRPWFPVGYFPGQVPGTQASSAPAQRLVAMEEEPEEKMIEAALRP